MIHLGVKSFAHFLIGLHVFLEWSHVSSLYIFEIKPLSEISLANMFSHMVGSLFILMFFSLAVQKLFILMRSHLFILSFMSLALGDISVKILLHEISETFLPVFSSRTSMVLCVTYLWYTLVCICFYAHICRCYSVGVIIIVPLEKIIKCPRWWISRQEWIAI